MNDRPVVTGRLVWGLVVLTLGVLWTLDNLRQLDASEYVRWWPVVPFLWGLALLTGIGARRSPGPGWWWTLFGAIGLLRPLGISPLGIFDFWPVIFILVGASLVHRAWTGRSWVTSRTDADPRLKVSAMIGGFERKVVTPGFDGGEIDAVIAGVSVDFRGSTIAGGSAVLDVFALWGGIVLLVPEGWRVESEVTPILGGFEDSTSPPSDPAAPRLVVRGSVVMGGIEVRNHERPTVRVRTRDGEREVRVGPAGVIIRGRREVRVGPDGVVITGGVGAKTGRDPGGDATDRPADRG